MKPAKNKDKKIREVLEARLKSLCEIFFLFAQNDYKVGVEENFLNKKLEKKLDRRIREKLEDFYADGEAAIVFRSFLLILGKNKMFGKNDSNVIPLYDYCFFIKFVRYSDNREMIEEIKTLGKLYEFTLQRMEDDFYSIRFF